MKEIFVFGHRNPDTDSVCSAIALSYLKNKLGLNTTPKILSDINLETKFVLYYFKVEKPEFINDVKVRIKDINYEKGAYINELDSIDKCFEVMAKYSVTAIPLVDNKNKIAGYITLKDLAKYLGISDSNYMKTTLTNIVRSLSAIALTNFEETIEGDVLVAALDNETFLKEIVLNESKILIVGNRREIIKKAIREKVKLIIISCDKELDADLIESAITNEVTIIKTKLNTFNIANKINLSNFINIINVNKEPIVLKEDDYYQDFISLASKKHHSNYPVINKKDKVLGLVKVSGENAYEKREVILVDHNTFSQSAVGLEEATILEIVDHHNLGAMNTVMPISFRSMPVGCTSTIIFKMFEENRVNIPPYIAGLMLSAIISDTLLFTSPTTTEEDKKTCEKLALIANLDVITYGKEMLKAASNIDALTVKELVTTDFKSYTLGEKQLGISVLTTMDFESIEKKMDEIREILNAKLEHGYDLSVMFATDVIKNGSYLIYNEGAENLLKDAFELNEIYQGIFIENLVSRKKQMLPRILEVLK